MPNWCANTAVFKHEDANQVTKLIAAFQDGCLFNAFVPCPEELHEQTPTGEDYVARDAARTAANIEKHGYASWYDWCVEHWGTKWDVDGEEGNAEETDPNTASLCFDSAWAPPIAFYNAMCDMGWEITAYYFEPGMNFCGMFNNGDDDYIEIEGDAAWVEENVPKELNDTFGISEMMADFEDDEQEEDGSD
jgi:hypothetical protein